MRTWMTEKETERGRIMVEMPDYLVVTIYADTVDQYTEEEIEELQNSPWGQMIEIPVPADLLKQWWFDCLEFDRAQPESAYCMPEDGWSECTDKDFWQWHNEESTADDCDSLYDWLVAHKYCWKRLDTEYSHAQHYGW